MADKIPQQYDHGPLAYLVAVALALFFAIPAHYANKAVPAPRATLG